MKNKHDLHDKWEFWIDRGGTFTDVVAHKPDGSLSSCKLLSENPEQYPDAAIEGIRSLFSLKKEQPLPVKKIAAIKMGTTVATNALLEQRGEDTVLVITRGFADALRIAYQNRPDLFSLDINLPAILYKRVIEVKERLDANGKIRIRLDQDQAKKSMQLAYDEGFRSVAIVLMHGYRFHQHEKLLADIASGIGFTQVSTSHQTSPLMKLVSRGDTTVVDAYLTPVLQRYIHQVSTALNGLKQHGGQLTFMQSSGGLTDAALFQGKDAILSGPAGGVVGMVRTARQAGFNKIIGFDMGGTSTDVSHYADNVTHHASSHYSNNAQNHTKNPAAKHDNHAPDERDNRDSDFERTLEAEIAGVRIRAPMMQIHTVAAGGGSILHFDGARFRVGPDSAGAFPGPCAYRNNGPLSITDCNVLLGKLQAQEFPAVFGENANLTLDLETVRKKFSQLAKIISTKTGKAITREAVASGFLKIAVENMANAIKKISVQRGYDVSDYVLSSFGGAGGQHACLVAEALGIKQIFIHPYAGVLSAYGMGLADTLASRQQSVEKLLDKQLLNTLDKIAFPLQQGCEQELEYQGIAADTTYSTWTLNIRYSGSDTTLNCHYAHGADTLNSLKHGFEALHQQRFGFISKDKAMIVEAIQVEVIASASPPAPESKKPQRKTLTYTNYPVFVKHRWQQVPFYQRKALTTSQKINGPAVILESTGTTVVEPGWQATLDALGNLILSHKKNPDNAAIDHNRKKEANTIEADPVMLEIFNNLFMSIAEQMGFVLANTATSVNIKERLDFSCAIFDQQGDLVANAPHMPVHLGSMSETIKAVIKSANTLQPGDAIVTNAPYNGGTHLPDITVVKPVFNEKQHDILFYVASRGHHADIGGKTPGSAPADSVRIEQEGIVIDNFKLVDQGIFQERAIRDRLASGRYPARNIDTNIADFKAQLAACEKGVQELSGIINYYGLNVVQAYMRHVQDNAEESVRQVLESLQGGRFEYKMDNGKQICVAISVDDKNRSACVDFSGTSSQHSGNYNAPLAICKAAVLYVFRCLVNDNIPLNEGCLKPLEIIVPEHSIINPDYPAAVIAGNVETSQYIVDTLFGALNVLAASQGTMNNLFWGNEKYQYYETLCGGAGATPQHKGADAVHTHMTNSRLTDPEVLEQRFPVILESFKIRENSGGNGLHRGGNGVIRKTRFLETMTATLLTGHRKIPPYGMAGGEPGKTGENRVYRADGSVEHLGSSAEILLNENDTLVIKTPGGGGYGKTDNVSD